MNRGKRNFLVAGLVGLTIIFLGFGIVCFSIYHGIRGIAREASESYGGDQIAAMVALVDDEGQNLRRRDKAVWALGQIGDPRALPVLEKYYTGEPCDHSRYLCQSELRKAIRKCRGGVNLTAWINELALRAP